MARIEGEQHGHTGRVREWLARAVNAPRDPAWTADGVVSDRWAPVSPVTGTLDAFRWRVPVEAIDAPKGALLASKVEALVGLGAGGEPALEHRGGDGPTRTFPPAQTVEAIDKPAPLPKQEPAAAPKPAAVPAVEAVARTPEPPAPIAARIAVDAGEPAEAPAAVEDPAPRRRPEPAPAARKKPIETKIFVPPRAPDDPGPEPDESTGLGIGPFRPSEAKA
jgi:HemY protein